MAVVELNVERWCPEAWYTSYVTIPGLRYRAPRGRSAAALRDVRTVLPGLGTGRVGKGLTSSVPKTSLRSKKNPS